MKQLEHFGIKNRMIRGDTKSYNSNLFSPTCKNCGNPKQLQFIEIDDNGNKIHLCKTCIDKRASELKIKHYY